MKIIAITTLLAFALAGTIALAQTEKKETPAKAEQKAAPHVTLQGKLVCLGCDLKTAQGARAACSAYGHKHALKTRDGKYINFLANQYSEDLISGEKYHNKDVELHGIMFADANMLDVESFTVDGQKKGWCGHCNAMDGCPFKKK